MQKLIVTWQWGNNKRRDEHTSTRGFIFGGYNSTLSAYLSLVRAALKDFPGLKHRDIELGKVTESLYIKSHILVTFALPENTTREGYANATKFDFNWH